ncbi:metallophosphoesterase, partial [Pseudomonadota bacterium]
MTRPERSSKNTIDDNRNLPPDSLSVLQLSDPHLFADPEGRLLGMRTLASLQHVITDVTENLSSIDMTLVTGDLVHDASPAGYALLKKQLTSLGTPTYCLPGNHDDPKELK